jgi:energy-converting hydrogenase Eha subunit C
MFSLPSLSPNSASTSQVHAALAGAVMRPIWALLFVVRLIRINGNKTAE